MKKMFKIGLLAAAVGTVYKVISAKKEEWNNLSEAEVRGKLSDKLSSKVPDDKLQLIGDKVVGKMRDRGRLRPEADA